MSQENKIMVPLPFEAFNALDVVVHAELADLNLALLKMPETAKMARANILRYTSRLNLARQILEAARPVGYRDIIKTQYERDFAVDN